MEGKKQLLKLKVWKKNDKDYHLICFLSKSMKDLHVNVPTSLSHSTVRHLFFINLQETVWMKFKTFFFCRVMRTFSIVVLHLPPFKFKKGELYCSGRHSWLIFSFFLQTYYPSTKLNLHRSISKDKMRLFKRLCFRVGFAYFSPRNWGQRLYIMLYFDK